MIGHAWVGIQVAVLVEQVSAGVGIQQPRDERGGAGSRPAL